MSKFPPYVCTLDAATQKKALDELYEDPKNRQGAIDTFREWILQQKHLKCPTDDVYLLAFLRAKHFSQLEARDALEVHLRQREQLPTWMKDLDPADSNLDKVLKFAPMMLLQGRDKLGRRIVIIRPGSMDPGNKDRMLISWRLLTMVFHYIFLLDETAQVHGVVFLMDFSGYSMAYDMKVSLEEKRRVIGMMQKTFPARVKGFHVYNAGAMLDILMNIIKRFFNDKLKKRLHVHTHGLESVFEHIPLEVLPEVYLPDDFSGRGAGSYEDVIAAMRSELCQPEIRAKIKHVTSKDFFIKMDEKDTEAPIASFRKLTTD